MELVLLVGARIALIYESWHLNLSDGHVEYTHMQEYRDVPGYTGLRVTRNGEVQYLDRWARTWKDKVKYWNDVTGYYYVGRAYSHKTTKSVSVHRAVALAWIPNPNGLPVVNHKDLDRRNNSADNLEWCTAQHNAQHSFMAHGFRGENMWSSKWKEEDIYRIRDLYFLHGVTQKSLVAMGYSNAQGIVEGKVWGHIPMPMMPWCKAAQRTKLFKRLMDV